LLKTSFIAINPISRLALAPVFSVSVRLSSGSDPIQLPSWLGNGYLSKPIDAACLGLLVMQLTEARK